MPKPASIGLDAGKAFDDLHHLGKIWAGREGSWLHGEELSNRAAYDHRLSHGLRLTHA